MMKTWDNNIGTGLYIHIPFCKSICTYCDFSKVYYKKKWVEDYLEALRIEIEDANINRKISTIYIGGGTPSSLSYIQLEKLFKIISPYTAIIQEFTIEINPETITIEKLKLFKKYGVTRLSIGVQTFNEKILAKINRLHTNQQVFDLIKDAKAIGFEDISIDLMYNLPGQSENDIINDLNIIKKLDIDHISYYSLILEKHTILYNEHYEGMDSEDEYKCSKVIINELEKMGFYRYEISNYAKKGHQSLHNMIYWHNKPYYGFGLGAHGFIENVRYYNTRKLSDYNQLKFKLGQEMIGQEDQLFESLMLGLRLVKGVSINQLNELFNINIMEIYAKTLKKYQENNMLVIENGYLKTTPLGMDMLHLILIDLMDNSKK